MRVIRPECRIEPRVNEAIRYMKCTGFNDSDFINKVNTMANTLSESILPLGCYHYVNIAREGGKVDIGFGKINSRLLERALEGCDRAALFCATLGQTTDRMIEKQGNISSLDQMICDALASSAVEVWADKIEECIKGELITNPRVSPGYGDFSIEYQRDILKILEAERIGVYLLPSMQMLPSKTVSAIFGIKQVQ